MKVLLFSMSDSLGGAEQVLYKIANNYASKSNTVVICFLKPETNKMWYEIKGNVKIHYCNNSILNMLSVIKSCNFNKVYSSHLKINSFLGICRAIGYLKTNKLIVRESTSVFGRYSGLKLLQYRLAYFFGYRKIDLVICQTQRMADVLKENVPFLFKRTNIKVIPNPFDFPNQELVNETIEIPENTIVSAGRLIPEKGFDILINAFLEITKKNPEMHLLILGEGDKRDELEKLISALGLDDKVNLKGHVKNVYPYFKKATVCVISSRREGFPNVLLQMMSQNNKVVSTLCAGGIKDIPGVYKANVNDVDSLNNAIMKSIDTNTSNNRVDFDNYLSDKSIESFMISINNYLYNEK